MNNFLPLDRSLLNHWVWEEKPFSKGQAWVDLLMLANYKDKKKPINGEVQIYKRGDVNLSMKQLADRWGWDRRTVKRFLDLLANDKMVSVNSTTHGTTITIVNYEVFNSSCTTECTTNAHQNVQPIVQQEEQPNVQQMPTTNKDNKDKEQEEIKEVKKEKKTTRRTKEPTVYYPNDEQLNQAFLDFMEMRNKIKKPMTDRAVTMAMNKLQKLAGADNDLAIKILEQSVLHCWQDLYELKDDMRNNKNRSGGIDWDNV